MFTPTWFTTRAEVARELALRLDSTSLTTLLEEAAAFPAPDLARRAQLRLLADGTLLLLELGAFDAGASLADRVAALAPSPSPDDPEARGLTLETRAAVASRCGALSEARADALAAVDAFTAANLGPRALAARVVAADLAGDRGELAVGRGELEALLARRDLTATTLARAQLALGKIHCASFAAGEARLVLRRVAPVEPWIHGRALIYLARAALRSGHATLAENEARAAATVLAGLPAIACAAHAVLAESLARQQRSAEALVAARAAGATTPAPDLARLVVAAQAELAATVARRAPRARTA